MTEPGAVDGGDPRDDIQTSLRAASHYNRWLVHSALSHVGAATRLVDAGAGSGNLTALLAETHSVVAVEVWPTFVEALRARFTGQDGVQVVAGDLADPGVAPALEALRPDGAVSFNVIEHIEDHRAVLLNLGAALPPGAPFFLFVPAFPVLYGAHDRADHHFRRYTKRSMTELVADTPWQITDMRYVNLPGFFAWFALTRVLRRTLDESSIGAYDRWAVPSIRRIEQRMRPPFGQSLAVELVRTA